MQWIFLLRKHIYDYIDIFSSIDVGEYDEINRDKNFAISIAREQT